MEYIELLMTLSFLWLICSMHLMCFSIAYRHTSEPTLYILVFCYLGSFINYLLVTNALSFLVQGSCKGLVFLELEITWVRHRPH